MALALRRFFALLSTLGLLASVILYVGSFWGLRTGPVSNMRPWMLLFFAGAFVTAIPWALAEYDGPLSDMKLYFRRFGEARPPFALGIIRSSSVFAMAHLAYFWVVTRGEKFDIVDGRFVLGDEVLSESRYLSLAGWETRFFASFMICIYLYMTLYWWYPRVKVKPGPYDE